MPLLARTPVQRYWCKVHIVIGQLLLAVVSHLADLHDAWGIQAALKKSWEVGVLHAHRADPSHSGKACAQPAILVGAVSHTLS